MLLELSRVWNEHNSGGTGSTCEAVKHSQIVESCLLHLLDLQNLNIHAVYNVWEKCNHVVVAHGHVGHNLLECILLCGIVLILLAAVGQLLA